MPKHEFRVLAGCPCPKLIAPYIDIVIDEAGANINSIYRAQDAASLLHKHGKHTQAELWRLFQEGKGAPANPPGFSTHELKSDGIAFPQYPRGVDLPWWAQGVDVNDSDVQKCIKVAARYHWQIFQPYKSGSEYHHWCFKTEPKPHSLGTKLRIWRLRNSLPRR